LGYLLERFGRPADGLLYSDSPVKLDATRPRAVVSLVTADICLGRPSVVWSDETQKWGTNDHHVDDPGLAGDSTHLVLHWICGLACAGTSQTSEAETGKTDRV